jgi:glutathione S-transferase
LDGEGMANGGFNKHLLGDILRSLQPRYLSQVKESISGTLRGSISMNLEEFELQQQVQSTMGPPTWENLKGMLNNPEKSFREKLAQGKVNDALATKRIFGNMAPRVTIYRDSASWCPYCQKCWIALEEKQISYNVVKVDMNCYAGSSKPAEFLKIQANGNLPCVVFEDGSVVGESDEILRRVNEMNVDNVRPLLPQEGTEEAQYMKYLCDDDRNSLERRLFTEWMWYLTGKRKPVEYRERYEYVLDEVESVLEKSNGGPFFLGKYISMADIKFIPFLERQSASLLYFKGLNIRDGSRWPNLLKWFQAMEERPSYLPTKSDIYTHSGALPPQLGADCTFAKDGEPMKDFIDALSIPLPSERELPEKAFEWRETGWNLETKKARREAAERIIHNKESIIEFACRGAGIPGLPAASAPLADPRAGSNDSAQLAVDVFLRYTLQGLLQQNISARDASMQVDIGILLKGGTDTVKGTVACLDYLRQRIGVPRDMSYPAAVELRSELRRVSLSISKVMKVEKEEE